MSKSSGAPVKPAGSSSSSPALLGSPSEKKAQNSELPVNKLPHELLSRIFKTAEEEDRVFRPRDMPCTTVLDFVCRVCHHWRTVATNDQSLWSYVQINCPAHNSFTELILARAGQTTLLDVDIEMGSEYWNAAGIDTNDWRQQIKAVADLLAFLATHGASLHRWRSLAVRAKQPEVLFKFIEFLNTGSASVLRYLSLEWKMSRVMQIEEERSLSYPNLFASSHSLTGQSFPNLRFAEINHLPWGFIFNRPVPLLGHLTTLSITAAAQLNSLVKLHELLIASPKLESLVLDSGYTYTDIQDPSSATKQEYPQVTLEALRSLSIGSSNCPHWILAILRMINAPNLHKFTFPNSSLHVILEDPAACTLVMKYVCTGQVDKSRSVSKTASVGSPSTQIYPALRELDVSGIGAPSEWFKGIMDHLSSVTCLSISRDRVDALQGVPCVLPNLTHLKLSDVPEEHKLSELLRHRDKEGCPIPKVTVELASLFSGTDPEVTLPKGVNLVRRRDQDLDLEYSDNEGNSEGDWLDGAELDDLDGLNDYDYGYGGLEEYEYQYGYDSDDDRYGFD